MVAFTPEQLALIERLVEEGHYRSPDDVVNHAFRLLADEIRDSDAEEAQLLAMLDADDRQPRGESLPADDVFADARKRLAEAAKRQAAE